LLLLQHSLLTVYTLSGVEKMSATNRGRVIFIMHMQSRWMREIILIFKSDELCMMTSNCEFCGIEILNVLKTAEIKNNR
jgi:hypothetical protein